MLQLIILMLVSSFSYGETEVNFKILKEKDEIHSVESRRSLILSPYVQIILGKASVIYVRKNLVKMNAGKMIQTSVIDFKRGQLKIVIPKREGDQVDIRIAAAGVTFLAHFGEFEVTGTKEGTDLDVVTGEVEVSSPFINTFVPVIIKAGEGFHFSLKEKTFSSKKFTKHLTIP